MTNWHDILAERQLPPSKIVCADYRCPHRYGCRRWAAYAPQKPGECRTDSFRAADGVICPAFIPVTLRYQPPFSVRSTTK